MRNISQAILKDWNKAEQSGVYLKLFTMEHESWEEAVYIVQNKTDITSNGITYLNFPFKIEPPNDSSEELSRVTCVLDNVDRRLLPLIRSLMGKTFAKCTLSLIKASDPDTVIGDVYEFDLRAVQYKARSISLELLADSIGDQLIPADDMSPPNNRGLFKETE